MAVRCGIDLGTTYSAISWYDPYNNRAVTIDLDTADGAKVIRSVVYFPGPGQPAVVGETAWNAARQHPDRVVVGIKRSIGTSFKTAAIDGHEYTPQEVSAEILKVLVQDAKKYLGEDVPDAVITVPAYFGDAERAATEEAGKIAGLNVIGVLPEPHAAALAYAVENAGTIQDRHILVYDLGGGTFDVTMIHATAAGGGASLDLNISTLCKDGNRHLGGLDWDRALAKLVIEKVLAQHGEDISNDADNEPLLLDNCEKAKRHLSRTGTVSIIADSKQHQVDVTAEEFENQTAHLLYQTQALLEHVIEEAQKNHGVAKDQIEVMLTGGSSRMPAVARLIETVLGRPPLRYQNPELLVTIGAAYRAHLLGQPGAGEQAPVIVQTVPDADGTPTKKEVRVGGLSDIGRPVGVEVLRAGAPANAVVVPDGSSYGQQFEKIFSTTEDGMTEIDVVLHEGSSAKLEECRKLKTFTITGLPADRPKGRPVKVVMGYDNSGIVRGKAIDLDTGTEIPIEVTPGF